MHRWVSRFSQLLLCLVTGCEHCPTEGCDALGTASEDTGPGIAGIVAYKTDVVTNDCQECAFGSTRIDVWRVDEALPDESAFSALVSATPPTQSLDADAHYATQLQSGHYVLCVTSACLNVSIAEGPVTTVNIKLRYGPTSFFVQSAQSKQFVEDFGVAISQ